MASISGDTSCATHAERLSAARCPLCEQFYCSECITEHEGKLICAGCLAAGEKVGAETREVRTFPLAAVAQFGFALLFLWLLFYFFAQTLGDIPDDFHDGTIWE